MAYTTKDAFMKAYGILSKHDNVSMESLLICQKVLNLDKIDILVKLPEISRVSYKEIAALAKKRATGYPLQYLLGEWEFYGRKFFVGEGVLIPRADTETLIEVVRDYAKTANPPLDILDLCSGTGCIAATLNKEIPESSVYAIENSPAAIEYLKINIKNLSAKVSVIDADALTYKTNKKFDIIVSNPPYLSEKDMQNLQKEVQYEPKEALYGGEDGLNFYRGLIEHWCKNLKRGGLMAFEVGIGQADEVVKMLTNKCSKNVCIHNDLCGIMRVVSGIKAEDNILVRNGEIENGS